jgi:hypothetical protein
MNQDLLKILLKKNPKIYSYSDEKKSEAIRSAMHELEKKNPKAYFEIIKAGTENSLKEKERLNVLDTKKLIKKILKNFEKKDFYKLVDLSSKDW